MTLDSFDLRLLATQRFGDIAVVLAESTQDGLFASLYQQASSGELGDGLAHHAPTSEANPTIDAKFLGQEEARDPESFRSEYLAEFVGGGASFLDPDLVQELSDRLDLR